MNSNDKASALNLDAAGNVYVTGRSWNGANDDYTTVKYDSAGAQGGVAIYNGPGNGNDNAVALAVDGKGNAYVTGSSFGASTGDDFATIKYTNNLIANAEIDKEICSGQSATIGGSPTATGGKLPYTYKWTPTTGLNNPTAPNPIATPAATTEYTVAVADAGGAKATDKILVTVKPCGGAVAVFPAPNALNVSKAANIAVIFNTGIDPTTLTNNTIRVNGSQSGLHTSSNITYDSGTKKATFDPASDFKPSEVVTVTLTTGIKSASGAALTSPYTWSFAIQSGGSSVFANAGNIEVGSNPAPVATGDFDGDGDLDLAVTNYSSNNVSILKNDGSGIFTLTPVSVGSIPTSVAVGDFDGDGDLDLAVGNYSSNTLSILKNGLIAEAGSNTEICAGQSATIGGNPTAANGAPPYIYKWTPITGLNNPAGANPIAKPAATTEYRVEVTDSSGAKATDKVIITVKPNDPIACAQTKIYTNDFEGSVGAEWSSAAVATSPNGRQHFLGEFGNQKVNLTLNGLPTHQSLAIEFDLYILKSWDGNDPVWGPDIWDLGVDGGQTLVHTTFSHGPPDPATQAFPGSFPGDGFPAQTGAAEIGSLGYSYWGDAVYHLSFTFNHASTSIILNFLASGLQGFEDESWGVDNMRIVASSNAARNPVVNAGPDKEICSGESVIIGGTPTGTGGAPPYKYKWTPTTGLNDAALANPTAKLAATTEYTVEVTDADGAKATDKVIVIAHGGADKTLCFAQTATNVGGAPTAIAAGDFDGDGDLDLAVTRRNSNNLAILQNDGRGNYSVVSSPGVGNQPLSVTAGDFDGDRDLDLAVTHYSDGFISLLFNSGKGDFAARTDYSMGTTWTDFVAAANVDRDSDLDLIVTGTYSGNVSILKNNGNGTFQPKVGYHFTRDADDAAIADLDNDGDLDLAATAWDAPGLTLFQNAGDGTFIKKMISPSVCIRSELLRRISMRTA